MAARDVPDRKGHREHRQAESEGDSQETDADTREGGSEYGAAASSENEPERTDEFCECTVYDRHKIFLLLSRERKEQTTPDPVPASYVSVYNMM